MGLHAVAVPGGEWPWRGCMSCATPSLSKTTSFQLHVFLVFVKDSVAILCVFPDERVSFIDQCPDRGLSVLGVRSLLVNFLMF